MTESVLIDTGPIVAILSASDAHHHACIDQLRKMRSPLVTCWPVITEAAWLLRSHPQAIKLLLSSFESQLFKLATLDASDLPDIAIILSKYEDLNLQLADASIVHLANRDGIQTIFTLDRRDFNLVRSSKRAKFTLVP